jgi:hypothetical protein
MPGNPGVIVKPKPYAADAGSLELTSFNDGEVYSTDSYYGGVAEGRTGSNVLFTLVLKYRAGTEVWSGSALGFSGIESSADEYAAEAHEVGPDVRAIEDRLLRRLAKESHCAR